MTVWRKEDLEIEKRIPISSQNLLSVAVSPEYVFVGGSYDEPFISVVDRENFRKVASLQEHSGSIFSLFVHENELLSGSADDTVSIWDVSNWSRRTPLTAKQHIVQAVVCDNDYIFVGGIEDFVGVYDHSSLKMMTDLQGHKADIFSLAIDEKYLYSGSGEVWWGGPGSPRPPSFETAIRVWKKKTWECIAVLEGHSDNVNSIAVDGNAVYSVADDGSLRAFLKEDWTSAGFIDLGVGPLKGLVMDSNDIYTGGASGEIYRVSKASFKFGSSK